MKNTVKGFRDILPPESLKRQKVRECIEEIFRRYGFLPIETPAIEEIEILELEKQQDEAISDMFKLTDKGKRKLGLRYEFTVQLPRILKENPTLKLPFKRYQIGTVWRDEPTKTGRYREFVQCDADIIGNADIASDAECLAVAKDIFSALGIETEVKVNNRKLLNSILEKAGIEKKHEVMKEVDKINKIPLADVKKNIAALAGKEKTEALFGFFEKNLEFFRENAFQGADEIAELERYCGLYGLKIAFVPHLARGLSYYTGTIFELFSAASGDLTIAAGGRYDTKVGSLAGKNIPAVGISFGLDRIADIANIKVQGIKSLLISLGEDEHAINAAQSLRSNGISCVLQFGKISHALDYANAMHIPFVIFIGKLEMEKKKLKLRDMKSGKEEMLTLKEIVQKLQTLQA